MGGIVVGGNRKSSKNAKGKIIAYEKEQTGGRLAKEEERTTSYNIETAGSGTRGKGKDRRKGWARILTRKIVRGSLRGSHHTSSNKIFFFQIIGRREEKRMGMKEDLTAFKNLLGKASRTRTEKSSLC